MHDAHVCYDVIQRGPISIGQAPTLVNWFSTSLMTSFHPVWSVFHLSRNWLVVGPPHSPLSLSLSLSLTKYMYMLKEFTCSNTVRKMWLKYFAKLTMKRLFFFSLRTHLRLRKITLFLYLWSISAFAARPLLFYVGLSDPSALAQESPVD